MGYYLMYLRTSRADEEKERYGKYETLAAHEEDLNRLAARDGYHVAQVYRELVSGETIAGRPEFRKVMERISDPDCDGILVHAVDRLGRGDPMEYGWILSTIRFAGALIVTPGRVYDTSRAEDIQQLKLQMFVSNIEFDHIRERLVKGSENAVRRGGYIGTRPPYGYDKAVVDRVHTLVPNEIEAPTVRLMFEMAASGSNKGAISRRLNSSGLLTRHGKLWTSSRVANTLSNPIYKGYVRYGHTRTKAVSRDGISVTKARVVSKEGDYVLARGVHEPLVSDEVWEQANRLAFEAVPVKRNGTIMNPLAGLIVCAKCGRALVRQDVKNKYGMHYPRLHHAYNTECQCKSVSIAYVMECLKDVLVRDVRDLEESVSDGSDHSDELSSIEAELRREDGRLDKLMELFYADAISVTEFKERRDASREKVQRLRNRHDELESMDRSAGEVVVRAREAIGMMADDSVSAATLNEALRSFISSIEYEELDRAMRNRKIALTIRLRAL